LVQRGFAGQLNGGPRLRSIYGIARFLRQGRSFEPGRIDLLEAAVCDGDVEPLIDEILQRDVTL
jgi:hypothetical protein